MTTRTCHTATLRSTAVAGVALAALLGLSACGDSGSTAASDAGSANSGEIAADAAYNEQDVTFAKDMKPHHEQAVEMADTVLTKDPSPRIKALAGKIRTAQEPEIVQLDALLAEFDVETDGSDGGHGMSKGSSTSTGMMNDDDMQALTDASGQQAETLFLEGMLEHHEGAVEMATQEIDAGEYPEAIELATKIKTAQQVEITEMEQLLDAA